AGDHISCGIYLDFVSEAGETIEARVGISYVSAEQAKRNYEIEAEGISFDELTEACREQWNDFLSRISVEDKNEKEIVKFYSAMYRAANCPMDVNENGVYCTGASGKPEIVRSLRGFYNEDWALWDTARTTHALSNLVEPERASDMVDTFIEIYKKGGWLPMATFPANGVAEVMIGHNAVPVIMDAWLHNYTDFDLETAYEAMKKVATCQNHVNMGLGTDPDYVKDGYFYFDDPRPGGGNFSVSRSLEVCWSDWCTAQVAKILGRDEDYEYFMGRAHNYEKLFDPETRFMRPKNSDGTFYADFNPRDSFKNGFCECTSWEYSFFVPHDIQGLINHMGGREEFVARLDEFFASGLFNYENETSIQVPYLYSYAGAPWKTQKVVRDCLVNNYWDTPNGLHGEDDSGAMSAWYTLAACGLYPANPSDAIYVINSPMFANVSFRTKMGVFEIKCHDFNEDNIYIGKALLNGEPLEKVWLSWDEIECGGRLDLYMTSDEANGWGTAPEAAPPSMTEGTVSATITKCDIRGLEDGSFELYGTVKNDGRRGSVEMKVIDGSLTLGKIFVFAEAGEEVEFVLPFRIYGGGTRDLVIRGENLTAELRFEQRGGNVRLGELKAVSKTCLSSPYVLYGSGHTVEASAVLKNIGSITYSGKVFATVDGDPVAEQNVSIKSGEELKVVLPLRITAKGPHRVSVGGAEAAVLDVATRPGKEWTAVQTIESEFYTSEDAVYIRAEGDNGKMEFGMLFRTEPVTGDFDAYSMVTYEELTCPYAPAMIVVKNSLEKDFDGFVMNGAMSKRGYHFLIDEGEYTTGYRYAPGCPEVPYYFKLEKRGNEFHGYYSTDNENWTHHTSAMIPKTAETQYVGLLVNAGCPVARLVKFEYLKIEKK
ncbi:MAG: glycoside hydrolase family 92 protein, partial [Clostridia bacterium]|nr:glycoside hydrolase family 92 protein [Clostridia bacterium]